MSVIITGFGTGGNNVTATLTAVSGGSSGTVTVALTTQANETHAGSGTTTATTTPGLNQMTRIEIWKPGDAGTSFYLKIIYGNGTNNAPRIRMTLGSATDGASGLSGIVTQAFETIRDDAVGGGSVPYECFFSGDTDRLGMMLWRNNSTNAQAFCIERTKNTDGTNNNDGVTLLAAGYNVGASFTTGHQTLVFGVGPARATAGRYFCALGDGNSAGGAYNTTVPVSPVFPQYGKYGNPMTTAAWVHSQDIGDGCIFTTTLYAATRTYVTGALIIPAWPANCTFCLRYD
jgi:hypothetical protein